MPNKKQAVPIQSNGGMYFEPARPGLPAPMDTTVPPTFTDQVLPNTNPSVQQPLIAPIPQPGLSNTPVTIPTKPGEWSRSKGYSEVTKT